MPHPCTKQRGLAEHRTPRERACHERCRPHLCNGLSSTTIRHIHLGLRGAYEKGVRWRWVSQNRMLLVEAPAAGQTRPAATDTRGGRTDRRGGVDDPD